MPNHDKAAMKVSWSADPAFPGHVTYYMDTVSVGIDDVGFEALLSEIRSRPGIRVVLVVNQPGSLGGQSLIDSLPFKDRFAELTSLLGPNDLSFEFL